MAIPGRYQPCPSPKDGRTSQPVAYTLPVRFDWDEAKSRQNQRKHGVAFEDAQRLLESDCDYLEIFDAEHSEDEDRFIGVGPTRRGILVVVWTDRGDDVVRIVSARMATKREAEWFRETMGGQL